MERARETERDGEGERVRWREREGGSKIERVGPRERERETARVESGDQESADRGGAQF